MGDKLLEVKGAGIPAKPSSLTCAEKPQKKAYQKWTKVKVKFL